MNEFYIIKKINNINLLLTFAVTKNLSGSLDADKTLTL